MNFLTFNFFFSVL